jgi:GntR family phosphonate transport system transcriptional regulator
MATRPAAGGPLWRRIASEVTSDIQTGVYGPGDRLPTETELAERFGVNRHTVRRAVGLLQDEGLVRIEQGRGTFVQEDIVEYPISSRTRFSEIIKRQARSPSGQLLRAVRMPASETVAAGLAIEVGAPVALIETLGFVDNIPISLVSHHFPLERFPNLLEAYDAERKITPMFRRLGIADYLRKTTRVTARLPDGREMRHLRLSRMTPVLQLEAVNVDSTGAVIEYGETRCSSNRVQIVVDTI